MMKLSELMAARCRRPRFFAIAIALGAAPPGSPGRGGDRVDRPPVPRLGRYLLPGNTITKSLPVTGQESLREH
jgi:hypothetical protein